MAAIDLANTWTVEEHTGGREGISAGPATGTYKSEGEAVAAIIAAYGRGNTATCIARDATGAGRLLVLGLVAGV